MPNKNYIKGRKKEWRIRKEYELMGWIVLRTAGSHGFADLIAIDKRNKKILFIQCKPDNYSAGKVIKLMEENKFCHGKYSTDFKVI